MEKTKFYTIWLILITLFCTISFITCTPNFRPFQKKLLKKKQAFSIHYIKKANFFLFKIKVKTVMTKMLITTTASFILYTSTATQP